MEDARLIIGGEVSLFKPVFVVIAGVEYPVKITYPELKKILELENSVTAGSIEALASMYDEAEMMTGAPRKILDTIDVREIREIIVYVADRIFHAEKSTPGEEKKGSGPGESK